MYILHVDKCFVDICNDICRKLSEDRFNKSKRSYCSFKSDSKFQGRESVSTKSKTLLTYFSYNINTDTDSMLFVEQEASLNNSATLLSLD